jgi:alkyldihydroxyacetonephosphate synthase
MYANDKEIPVVPFGAGSGVCGATLPVKGGVILDMKKMNRLLSIDPESLCATFETGIMGEALERCLNISGFTMGHFPSSISCSTLGGWLATRSAGQFASKYGKIEDMILAMKVVSPDGTILETPMSPFPVGGIDWNQIFVGSEGTLGVITEVTMRIHRLPQSSRYLGFSFPGFQKGIGGLRRIMQAELNPVMIRLDDQLGSIINLAEGLRSKTRKEKSDAIGMAEQALIGLEQVLSAFFIGGEEAQRAKGFLGDVEKVAFRLALAYPRLLNYSVALLPSRSLMIIGFEGDSERVKASEQEAVKILKDAGGKNLGSGPGLHWLKNRYQAPFKQSQVYQLGVFADTMDVATTWDKIFPLYMAVRRAMEPYVFIMAHVSHAYRHGCAMHFTFAGAPKESTYDKAWNCGLSTVHRMGATISHHHGIGLLKMKHMKDEHGEGHLLFRALKQALDPKNIMNPGKLWPENHL